MTLDIKRTILFTEGTFHVLIIFTSLGPQKNASLKRSSPDRGITNAHRKPIKKRNSARTKKPKNIRRFRVTNPSYQPPYDLFRTVSPHQYSIDKIKTQEEYIKRKTTPQESPI